MASGIVVPALGVALTGHLLRKLLGRWWCGRFGGLESKPASIRPIGAMPCRSLCMSQLHSVAAISLSGCGFQSTLGNDTTFLAGLVSYSSRLIAGGWS